MADWKTNRTHRACNVPEHQESIRVACSPYKEQDRRERSSIGTGPNWSASTATPYFTYPRLPLVGSVRSAGSSLTAHGSFSSLGRAKRQPCCSCNCSFLLAHAAN